MPNTEPENRGSAILERGRVPAFLFAAGGSVTTADLYAPTLDALGLTESTYSLAVLRYDLAKLRARAAGKVPHSRRYRLVGKGYSICLVFLKLFENIYAPLTAGSWRRFAVTASWPKRIAANSTACIDASLTISMPL